MTKEQLEEAKKNAAALYEEGKSDEALEVLRGIPREIRDSDDEIRALLRQMRYDEEAKGIEPVFIEKELQDRKTVEERMAPYVEKIEKAKEELKKREPVDFDKYFGSGAQEQSEYAAVMAYMEEYELLERFLNEKKDIININTRAQFSYWQPSALYFITSKKVREKMKDPCSMIRFLVTHGADVNLAAGDGSTPLWNQTTDGGTPEIMQTLLELRADPNQISKDGESEFAPLPFSLLPLPDPQDEEGWLPFDDTAIKKATLLLEHGANPNLASPSLSDFPALMMAVTYGFPDEREPDEPLSPNVLKLIELLLEKGADPNFIDSNGNTPLSLAAENDLLDAGKILLEHGAKMPDKNHPSYEMTDEEFKERARSFEEKRRQYFEMDKKYESKSAFAGTPLEAMLAKLREDCEMVLPPASADSLLRCDIELERLWLPELPMGYINFLKICNGYAFDGVELYGTSTADSPDPESNYKLRDIVWETCNFREDYGDDDETENYPLLCIGQRNGDRIIYDSESQTYQLRDHETAFTDVLEESDNFNDFFDEVVVQWSVEHFRNNNEEEKEPETSNVTEKNYQTTFNYLLTHRVIPQLMFSHFDQFYKNILPNPDNLEMFMQTAVQHAGALASGKPDIEPPYKIEKFTMGIYGDSFERSIIRIQIPKCRKILDCVEIAFPVMKESAGYFTSEFSISPINNEPLFMLGEWRVENGEFRHYNYGKIDTSHVDNFAARVIHIAYGDK
nr:hypothetical protein [uncultured bacterium]